MEYKFNRELVQMVFCTFRYLSVPATPMQMSW